MITHQPTDRAESRDAIATKNSCEFLHHWFYNMVKFIVVVQYDVLCHTGVFLQIDEFKHCLIQEMLVLSHLLDLLVLFISSLKR